MKKPRTESIDLQFIVAMAERMGYGTSTKAYEDFDWLDDSEKTAWSKRSGKILRHLAKADPRGKLSQEERRSHLAAIACNAMMLWGALR